jgi:hypothetical protein
MNIRTLKYSDLRAEIYQILSDFYLKTFSSVASFHEFQAV